MSDNEQALDAAREIAEMDPIGCIACGYDEWNYECVFCEEVQPYSETGHWEAAHKDTCLWLRLRRALGMEG